MSVDEKCRQYGIIPTKNVERVVFHGHGWEAQKLLEAVREAILDFGPYVRLDVSVDPDQVAFLTVNETVRRTEKEIDDFINQSEPF